MFLGFGKKYSLRGSGVLRGFTDHHSHILPGVDDGVRTMKEALAILAIYEREGVREVWLTPHIMEDVPNTPAALGTRFQELQAAYYGEEAAAAGQVPQGKINLHLAAENMIDNLFEERLEQGELMPIGTEGTHLLVETSYFNPPMDLYGTLQQIKSKGYHPILAHPERYVYMSLDDYHKLKDMDIKFQMNLFSPVGMYGHTVQKRAEWLLKKGMIDTLGSDLHRLRGLEDIIATQSMKRSLKKEGMYEF